MSEAVSVVPIDISRVKDSARLLAKWTGRPLSECQELTARAMQATSWQNLLVLETFEPDESLSHELRLQRIRSLASLLSRRLEIPEPTALRLAAFWQPTALRKSASLIFWLDALLEQLPVGTGLPARWLNQRPTMPELLKLGSAYPFPAQPDLPTRKTPEPFFSMARDGYIFRAALLLELYILVEEKDGSGWDYRGGVALGPGSVERDDRGGYMLAKYRNQPHAHLSSLTTTSARDVAHAFGLPDPERSESTNASFRKFFGSDAALGLAAWLVKHPRKATQLNDHSDVYMGAWPNKMRLRLEFELVHAGLLI